MNTFLNRGDILLLVVLAVVGTGSWLAVRFLQGNERASSIKIVSSADNLDISLRDTVLVLDGPSGETEVTVEDSKVWVSSATCPQKLCSRQGRISRPGESIVCLPNRVVITVKGESRIDAFTY